MGLKTKDVGVFGTKMILPFDDRMGVRFVYIVHIEEERLLANIADLEAQIRANEF